MTSLSTMGKFEHKVMIVSGYGIRMDVPEKLLKKNGHCLFSQFSFVFSALRV
jgi:hypothetical protein